MPVGIQRVLYHLVGSSLPGVFAGGHHVRSSSLSFTPAEVAEGGFLGIVVRRSFSGRVGLPAELFRFSVRSRSQGFDRRYSFSSPSESTAVFPSMTLSTKRRDDSEANNRDYVASARHPQKGREHRYRRSLVGNISQSSCQSITCTILPLWQP